LSFRLKGEFFATSHQNSENERTVVAPSQVQDIRHDKTCLLYFFVQFLTHQSRDNAYMIFQVLFYVISSYKKIFLSYFLLFPSVDQKDYSDHTLASHMAIIEYAPYKIL
jgi:hypothetical protein